MGFGIDFGTTRTVVAYADRKNYPVVSFETDTGDSVEWFPSVVAERGGELRFGFDALAVAADPAFTLVRSFKRMLSGSGALVRGTVAIGGVRLEVHEFIERFIAAMGAALRERSNLPKSDKKKNAWDAVIATPATAFCTQRFVTLEAFRAAGFDVRAMLNEPSAAGFEYTHRHRNTLTAKRDHVVVYDLGGGTFDASLVRISGTHHEVVLTSGIPDLGGDDFDGVLVDLVRARAGAAGQDLSPHVLGLLRERCRDAKERLGPSTRKVSVDLDGALSSWAIDGAVTVPVDDYYEACEPLIMRTLDALHPVVARGLGEAMPAEEGELADDVAGLYVVGGASAFPPIGRQLRARYGRRVHRSPYPHAAVAIGLAIASDRDAGFELDDRFARNFGVFREADGGTKASYDAIFRSDDALPRPGSGATVVSRRYRPEHNVGHFRFFECAKFNAEGVPEGDLAPLIEARFPFDATLQRSGADLVTVPVRRLEHDRPLVEERYALDANGMVEVTFTDLGSGYSRTFRAGERVAR